MQTKPDSNIRVHRDHGVLPLWLVLGMLLCALFLYLFPPDVQQFHSPASPPPGAPREARPSLFLYPVSLSEANAACSNQCTIQVCVRWIPGPSAECPRPGPGGGCCTDYENQCDPDCQEEPQYQPPAISAGQSCSQNGTNGWCTGTLTLNLSASDPQGQTVLISGDAGGAAFACASGATSCNVPLPEGYGAVTYTVTSATGLSASGSQSYYRDATAPQINGSLSGTDGDNGWYISDVDASATASDADAGVTSFMYSLNGGAWTNYAGAITLTDGEHTLEFRAGDAAGNLDQISQDVKIDTITPVLEVSLSGTPGEDSWYKSNVQVTASATDNGSGVDPSDFEYSLDGGAWTDYSGPLTLSDGIHSLTFRALDEAGNETPAYQDVYVDTQTPLLNLSINGTAGDGGWYVSDIEVSAAASDATSGLDSLEYSADGGAWTAYNDPLPYTDGEHSLKFRAIDNAGNITLTPTQAYNVDNDPPVIDLPSEWNLGQTVEYEVTDTQSGVYRVRLVIEDDLERWPKLSWYGLAQDEIAWDGRWADKNRAPDGQYYATIKAGDWAGNESSKEAVITVENNLLTLLIPPFNPPTDEPVSDEGGGEGENPTTSFGGEDNLNDSPTVTGLFTAGGVTTVAGASGTLSFASPAADASSAGSPLPGVPQSDILWGAAAVAAVSAFTEEIARRKREEDAARAASAEQRAKKMGKKEKPKLTYKQIAAAYQASLNNFNAALKNAQAKGMSTSQAEALRKQVAQEGKIGGALGVAQGYVAPPKAARKGLAAPPKAPVKPPPMPTGLSPEAQQAFLRGGSGAQAWINSNAPQLQGQHAQDVAAAKQVTGKGKLVAKRAEDKIDPPPPPTKSFWERAGDWIEENILGPIDEKIVQPTVKFVTTQLTNAQTWLDQKLQDAKAWVDQKFLDAKSWGVQTLTNIQSTWDVWTGKTIPATTLYRPPGLSPAEQFHQDQASDLINPEVGCVTTTALTVRNILNEQLADLSGKPPLPELLLLDYISETDLMGPDGLPLRVHTNFPPVPIPGVGPIPIAGWMHPRLQLPNALDQFAAEFEGEYGCSFSYEQTSGMSWRDIQTEIAQGNLVIVHGMWPVGPLTPSELQIIGGTPHTMGPVTFIDSNSITIVNTGVDATTTMDRTAFMEFWSNPSQLDLSKVDLDPDGIPLQMPLSLYTEPYTLTIVRPDTVCNPVNTATPTSSPTATPTSTPTSTVTPSATNTPAPSSTPTPPTNP